MPTERESPTVLIVDEEAIFRRAVRQILDEGGLTVVGEARNAAEAVSRAEELRPDVVGMAMLLRGSSGIEATREVLGVLPDTRVLILTKTTDAGAAAEAIRAGACGFLLKKDPSSEIVSGFRSAAEGNSPLSPRIAAKLLPLLREELLEEDSPDLTSREEAVLRLLADGSSNTEIAAAMSISVYTVKRHVSHLLGKLGVKNRTQAAVEATRRGML